MRNPRKETEAALMEVMPNTEDVVQLKDAVWTMLTYIETLEERLEALENTND